MSRVLRGSWGGGRFLMGEVPLHRGYSKLRYTKLKYKLMFGSWTLTSYRNAMASKVLALISSNPCA